MSRAETAILELYHHLLELLNLEMGTASGAGVEGCTF